MAGCFKVNISGGGGGDSLSKAEMTKVNRLCSIAKAEPEYEHIQAMVQRENEYVQRYESEIAPQR